MVAAIRRVAGTRKVGHAGTLDPMATGLLVLGINAGTRMLHYIVGSDKSYQATIRFGVSTDTEDAEGTPVSSPGCKNIEADLLERALEQNRGNLMQVPSAVSAIKVDGKRAYARVRAGENVEIPARPVCVSQLESVGEMSPTVAPDGTPVLDLDIETTVSSGTYVRALGRDLGIALGCPAHLTSLRRTRVGPWSVQQSTPLERVSGDELPVLSLGSAGRELFGQLVITMAAAERFRHGGAPNSGEFLSVVPPPGFDEESGTYMVFGQNDTERALGLVEVTTTDDGNEQVKTRLVFAEP